MSARRPPDDVRKKQIDASDPQVSAWVAANAGAGKTHVLAQRVVRLLLDGVDPGKILCITFTKAAAANMANRVFEQLAEWTALDDVALDHAIAAITGRPGGAAQRVLARRLFASALETPGGLKVQTIHAFCASLLHQFPFEANVAARFRVLDEAAETQLLADLNLAVLLDAAADPEGRLGRALAVAITAAADQTFKEVVTEAIGLRDLVEPWSAGGVVAMATELSRALGLDPSDSVAALEAEFFNGSRIGHAEWPTVAAALAEGSKADHEQIERIEKVRTARADERVDRYLKIFCTGELDPRKNIVTRKIQQRHPDLFARLMAEQERVCALVARRRAIACRDRTLALLAIAETVLSRYGAEKRRRGLLDYDDLIDHTLTLFRNTSAAWVLYKLDLGIDHVLIDEAQDTSPKQWEIVETIVAEFAAGAGARGGLRRTIFAVGDEKQSIFSFQGAAPHKFAEMRRSFQGRFKAAGLELRDLRFEISFRSGASVLAAVDAVFAQPRAYQGLTADPVPPVHRALPDAAPGLVEVWPLIKAEKVPEIEGWDAPFDELPESSPPVRLAHKIARTVAAWMRQGTRAGDVLILVRQRGALFEAVIRALKNAGIAVAGADRLILGEHIAVMDLMVLADALLLPDDDLALATVLKSPLFGLDEAQLFDLAWNRRGSLRTALRRKAETDPHLADIAARLDRLAAAAPRETPFSFYAGVLGADGGRRKFLARLGTEAADALDEFLNLALDYERRETPSLQGFLAWMRTAQTEVKRDMEIGRDEVRVMTVHGAKGLEARTVILADTTTKPAGPRDPRLLRLPPRAAPPGTPDRIIWARGQTEDVAPMRAARERTREAATHEYRRLLYVAMTRAADRLVICGTEGQQKRPDGCWYDLVHDALIPLAREEPADDGDGTVWRYRKGDAAALPAVAADAAAASPAIALPSWLLRDALRDAATRRPLAPSEAEDDAWRAAPLGTARRRALARGRLAHRLLQYLPDVPPAARADAAQAHIARAAPELPADERAVVAERVLHIVAEPRFADLFAPGSRAEVPIVGRLPRPDGEPVVVSGQVDRLAVNAEAVLIADFKSDRAVPRRFADVPPAYTAQLALYRAVLQRLYPGRPVRAALVWTHVPDLMEIPAADLDAALHAVTSP